MTAPDSAIDPKIAKVLDKAGLKYHYIKDCLLIYGSIPMDIPSKIAKNLDKNAQFSMPLQSNSRATMVIGNQQALDALKESDEFKAIARNNWASKVNKLNGKGDANFYSTLPENVRNWLETGHHGSSPMTLLNMTLGKSLKFHDDDDHYDDYPVDVQDFNRCLKLVDAVPEIRDHFPKMEKLSKEWKNVIAKFDDLGAIVREADLNKVKLFDVRDEFKQKLNEGMPAKSLKI